MDAETRMTAAIWRAEQAVATARALPFRVKISLCLHLGKDEKGEPWPGDEIQISLAGEQMDRFLALAQLAIDAGVTLSSEFYLDAIMERIEAAIEEEQLPASDVPEGEPEYPPLDEWAIWCETRFRNEESGWITGIYTDEAVAQVVAKIHNDKEHEPDPWRVYSVRPWPKAPERVTIRTRGAVLGEEGAGG